MMAKYVMLLSIFLAAFAPSSHCKDKYLNKISEAFRTQKPTDLTPSTTGRSVASQHFVENELVSDSLTTSGIAHGTTSEVFYTVNRVSRNQCSAGPNNPDKPEDVEFHRDKCDELRAFSCSICGKTFTRRQSQIRHEEVHLQSNPFQCEYCGRNYRYKRDLVVHYRCCHQNSTLNENSYKCEICDQEFRFELHLKKHAQVHSADAQIKCNNCGRLYLCKKSLYVHKYLCKEHSLEGKSIHAHPEFVCEICGNTFRTKVVLKRHQQIHSAGESFDCNFCGKRYAQKASLWRHKVQKHTIEARDSQARQKSICGNNILRMTTGVMNSK